ncbi:ABC transporter thiamine pyrophosphate-binding lipoprotein p37/Cypl [Mycoplasma seminis]|uniref:High affinity transport system protein p37 n=1 Tax=Mycoplasma seminis TaxID=512749 RepID=A0ABY9HBQ7_9MOLU|nr:hypothetical protein [Mycoplasma seminis]WLP85798.1 hypothetical protein Q8852_01470 [Mycoplasma seminis]
MKLNKLKLLLLAALGFSPIATMVSCSNNSEIKLSLIKPTSMNETNLNEYKNKLETQMNDYLKNNGHLDMKFKITLVDAGSDSYNVVVDSLTKGESDLGFISVGSIIGNEKEIENEVNSNVIQTYTKQFNGDILNAFYTNNGENLQQAAKNEQVVFDKIRWSEKWNEPKPGNQWDGSLYQAFYNDNNVSYQRGLIAIVADKSTTAEIVKAWNDKNLNKFISYGLGIGKPDSGSKYILPEALMKKHFNSEKKQFESLEDLKIKNPNKIHENVKLSKASEEKNKDIHIFFDNEGSYSWTHFKDKIKFAYATNPATRQGETISFLTLTDPLPFNIGLLSKRITDNQYKIIYDALKNTLSGNEVSWGKNVGFSDFGKSNIETVLNTIKNSLGE